MKKLVRDRIPEIIKLNTGKESKIYIADDEEYYKELVKKLEEETKEFIESHQVEELVDILEVIYAITKHKNITLNQLEEIRKDKTEKKGNFDKKYIWESDL